MAWTIEPVALAYCPVCGDSLSKRPTDDGERPHCPTCSLTVYENPVPMARATVVGPDSVLLTEMGEGRDAGKWALPGGHISPSEPPRVAAARELAEETGLDPGPAALTLIGDGHLTFPDGEAYVSFNYAASRTALEGEPTPVAGDDAADVRFWSRGELEAETPQLKASGLAQVLAAMDRVGAGGRGGG